MDPTTPTTPTKRRTITLTGRRPVAIVEDDWPTIAVATGDSYDSSDVGKYHQAVSRGECDRYAIRVRRHADGRAIVYAVLDAADKVWGAPAGGEDYRGGELITAGADIAAAIERVGTLAGIPAAVIRECVADLPPEVLDGFEVLS